MALLTTNADEPLTPVGRLLYQPEFNTIIHCAIGFKHHLKISCIKSAIASSLMVQHPRFRSILLVDKNGVEHWRPTEISVDRHIVVVEHNNNKDSDVSDNDFINDYIADLTVSSPLSTDKPLWEVHILWDQKCMVFRIHHALADGISLMSLLLAESRKGDGHAEVTNFTMVAPPAAASGKSKGWLEALMGILKMLLFSLIFYCEFLLRGLWASDRKTVITGGNGIELWPRKMVTARFLVDDLKVVKRAVPNATINDVLSGVISAGLSRYLDHCSPKSLKEGTRITGVTMVNLRQQPGLQELSEMMKRNSTSPWGNKIGMLLLPIYYHKGGVDPLQYVKQVKKTIDRRKQSFVAHFSYKIIHLLNSFFGPKVTSGLSYRFLCNTTFLFSNVMGPKEEITIAENPITFIRINISSTPHALTMHLTSYGNWADMQILVAKDIVPDPEFLAKCFEDALLEMKEAAAAAAT